MVIKTNPNNYEHEFALCISETPAAKVGEQVVIRNEELCHRITRVLRLHPEERLVLFDQTQSISVQLISTTKKDLVCVVEDVREHKTLNPTITVAIGLLKREAFEQVLYSCVELGAQIIQPLITQKIHKNWFANSDSARLERIMIAAAEQSKQFVLPELNKPVPFGEYCAQINKPTIFFDADGHPAGQIMRELDDQVSNGQSSITIIVGPEGDLTQEEKQVLRVQGVTVCALTPTILRAPQALVVALGMIRSLV